jgi:peptidoglycan/xylan/chitin deacetylase (PgdA/CDA1 family)
MKRGLPFALGAGALALVGAVGPPGALLHLPRPLPNRSLELPILLYHRVDRPVPTLSSITQRLTVDPQEFAAEMSWVKRHGFHALTQRQLFAGLEEGAPLPCRPLLVTFDDGYSDVFDNAAPVLRRLGMPATMYVITGRPTLANSGFLTWRGVRQLASTGFDIGSHTVTHRPLTALSSHEVVEELVRSRHALEQHLGASSPVAGVPARCCGRACRRVGAARGLRPRRDEQSRARSGGSRPAGAASLRDSRRHRRHRPGRDPAAGGSELPAQGPGERRYCGGWLCTRFGERSLNPRRDVRRCGGPRHDQNLQAVVVLDDLVLAHLGERFERRSEAVRMDGDLRAASSIRPATIVKNRSRRSATGARRTGRRDACAQNSSTSGVHRGSSSSAAVIDRATARKLSSIRVSSKMASARARARRSAYASRTARKRSSFPVKFEWPRISVKSGGRRPKSRPRGRTHRRRQASACAQTASEARCRRRDSRPRRRGRS